MAFNLQTLYSILISVCLVSSLFARHSLCSSPEQFVDRYEFSPALGTWYGDPNGAGSGGACGWDNDVQKPPFSAMIAAGNSRIFLHGKGCGECYQIKCSRAPYCSKKPITVTITDECPGACNDVPFHFDLSGTAFGAMANPGQAANLRNLGQVDIQYRRVPCYYGRTKIAFKINAATNPNWFATAIEFEDGDGGLRLVEIAAYGTQHFVPMSNIWGAVWASNINQHFHGPFSFRLTSPTNKVVVATNVVPRSFLPGNVYFSHVNF